MDEAIGALFSKRNLKLMLKLHNVKLVELGVMTRYMQQLDCKSTNLDRT